MSEVPLYICVQGYLTHTKQPDIFPLCMYRGTSLKRNKAGQTWPPGAPAGAASPISPPVKRERVIY